jgi:hypothetical protein
VLVIAGLTPQDQAALFEKVAKEHRGMLILSGPIIGEDENRKYFTHQGLIEAFVSHSLHVQEFHNLNFYRRGAWNILAVLARLSFCSRLLDLVPERLVYQRCYAVRIV